MRGPSRTRAKQALIAGTVVAALIAAGASAAVASPPVPLIDGEARDCTQIPPEELPPIALDRSKILPLEARVMVEKGDLELAERYMRSARDAYERIGVALKVSYDVLVAPKDLGEASSQDQYLEFMRDHYGGQRPKGVDVVYYMTRYWSGGFADCIGGVRFPDAAFAFGSTDYSFEGTGVPAPTVDEGVIAAHEIGHLLGAHHHYSNCAESVTGLAQYEIGACTVMSPLAYAGSKTFGTLEASFIRYYTAKYAKG